MKSQILDVVIWNNIKNRYACSFWQISINRHAYIKTLLCYVILWMIVGCQQVQPQTNTTSLVGERPNILLVISDDQSYPHASAYGYDAIQTPAFDRIAREGILFNQAFAASPGCSPSRAALLTGLNCWQIEEAGTHASSFPQYSQYFDWAVDKRPAEELYDIQKDPACLINLADSTAFYDDLLALRTKLGGYLMRTQDPRVTGMGEVFETYPRLRGTIRKFPEPVE